MSSISGYIGSNRTLPFSSPSTRHSSQCQTTFLSNIISLVSPNPSILKNEFDIIYLNEGIT